MINQRRVADVDGIEPIVIQVIILKISINNINKINS
jgi:hypothetical protein